MSLATRALFTGSILGAEPALSYPPTDDSWTRQGAILTATLGWEQTAVVEPELMVEDGLFRLWYRGGWDSPAVGYASCATSDDPTDPADWTKHGDPVYGRGGSDQPDEAGLPFVLKVAGTYYLSAIKHISGTQAGMVFATSPDGIEWTTVSGSITLPSGATLWGNRAVWYDAGWKMLAEAYHSGVWKVYRYTASDGLTWSAVGGALTTLQVAAGGATGGPTFATSGTRLRPRIDGLYHAWYHAAPGSGNLPTNIYHSTSADLATWTTPALVLEHTGTGDEVDQVADPRVVAYGANAYLFYATGDNVAEEGTIALATAAATV